MCGDFKDIGVYIALIGGGSGGGGREAVLLCRCYIERGYNIMSRTISHFAAQEHIIPQYLKKHSLENN